MPEVAALFVSPKGPYVNRPDVDAWPESRDARNYRGPLPVVAHPPCARWCRLAKQVEFRGGKAVGDDNGTFRSALDSVLLYGGCLEHPAFSYAWAAHGLIRPSYRLWQRSTDGYWTCEVWQSMYGHEATKATWLIYVGVLPPAPMLWGRKPGEKTVTGASSASRTSVTRRGDGSICVRKKKEMSHSKRHLTPPAFAEALISLARNCGGAP